MNKLSLPTDGLPLGVHRSNALGPRSNAGSPSSRKAKRPPYVGRAERCANRRSAQAGARMVNPVVVPRQAEDRDNFTEG